MLHVLIFSAGLAAAVELPPKGAANEGPGAASSAVASETFFIDAADAIPVKELIKTLARASGKNVVLDRAAGNAKVAVAFPSPLAKDDAVQTILRALEAGGLSVQEDEARIRVAAATEGAVLPVRPLHRSRHTPG